MPPTCPCCLKRPVHRNGLCFACEFEEPRRVLWYAERALPEAPCRYLPGSAEKVAALEERRAAGVQLWHPDDLRMPTFAGPVTEIMLACLLQRVLEHRFPERWSSDHETADDSRNPRRGDRGCQDRQDSPLATGHGALADPPAAAACQGAAS